MFDAQQQSAAIAAMQGVRDERVRYLTRAPSDARRNPGVIILLAAQRVVTRVYSSTNEYVNIIM
jgi:hypothetical protein